MMATTPGPSWWAVLSPREQKIVKRVGWFVFPTLILGTLFGEGAAKGWAAGYGMAMIMKMAGWALSTDKDDALDKDVDAFDKDKFNRDFGEELYEIESQVRSDPDNPPPPPPPKKPVTRVKNQYGELMMCLLGCGKLANERGRFCDDHDDDQDNPFYQSPQGMSP